LRCLAVLLALILGERAMAQVSYTLLEFDSLDGWIDDDHAAALAAFQETCIDLRSPEWERICAFAETNPPARTFFESLFRPVLIEDGHPMLFTGYFEPEVRGALQPDERYRFPVYRLPDDLTRPYFSRREIDEGALAGRDLEIAWLDDPVDLFFLQVQGSGRIRLPNGQMIRLGYAGANGRDYSSIGQALVAQGVFEAHQVSAPVIRSWVTANPEAGQELLWTNASYVFFREVNEVPPEKGPLGAMNRSVTTLRSVAVDPAFVTLGAPVWIEKDGAEPMNRLMVAQDTGSAIKGAQRADIFFGTGHEAGRRAGEIRDGGRMIVLLPTQLAYALVPERLIGSL
jgi:membrane-bound lytic murein transglycosylase A